MPIRKEPTGRRSVQVEVEVPGSPEEVWRAIATGAGISSWFVPTTSEERVGGATVLQFGPDPRMESRSTITAWNPPYYSAHEGPLTPDDALPWPQNGSSKHSTVALASSVSFTASSPTPTTGIINSPAPNPAGLLT